MVYKSKKTTKEEEKAQLQVISLPVFGIARKDGNWVFVQLNAKQSEGGAFTVEDEFTVISEPDMLSITQEKFKIAVGKWWGKLTNE